jgi:hypothetical protein
MNRSEHGINVIVWTLLTTVGLSGGLIAGLLVGMPLGKIANAMVVTAAVTCCVGAVLGACQAFGLRRLFDMPARWIAASTIGAGVGLALGVVLVEQTGILLTGVRPNIRRVGLIFRAIDLAVVGAVTGLCLGAAQAFVTKMRRWAVASSVSMAVAFAGSSLLVELVRLRFASIVGVITFVIVAGVLFGALTGRYLDGSKAAALPPQS